MRCYCCDRLLTPQEATRKFTLSNTYTDTCDKCLREIEADTTDGEGYEEKEEYEGDNT